ncbi:hypothetical protein BD770DRAFT_431605, partial [Pilaira anomala]
MIFKKKVQPCALTTIRGFIPLLEAILKTRPSSLLYKRLITRNRASFGYKKTNKRIAMDLVKDRFMYIRKYSSISMIQNVAYLPLGNTFSQGDQKERYTHLKSCKVKKAKKSRSLVQHELIKVLSGSMSLSQFFFLSSSRCTHTHYTIEFQNNLSLYRDPSLLVITFKKRNQERFFFFYY